MIKECLSNLVSRKDAESPDVLSSPELMMPFPKGCTHCGKCADVCPADARTRMVTLTDADDVLKEIQKHRLFYSYSGGGITFWLGGNECWANPTDDGGLYGGVGFLPWMCGHMKDAEHALRWCRRMLGIEVSDG